MKRSILIIFAAIVVANMSACMKKEGCKVPVMMRVSLVAIDKDGNDLFDSTAVNAIDVAALSIVTSDVDFKSSDTYYGYKLLNTLHSPYHHGNIFPVKIGQTTKNCGTIELKWFAMDDFAERISLVKWGNGIVDTLHVKIRRRTNSLDDHCQLYANKQLVWDSKVNDDGKRVFYIRRFE